jgi:PAS domain S-box
MRDKTQKQLVTAELEALRREVAELRQEEAKRKKVEGELKDSEGRFKSLFENSRDAIFIADLKERKIIECNKKLEEFTGYSRQQLLSMRADNLCPEDRIKGVMAMFEEQTPKESQIVESEILGKGLKRIPVSTLYSSVEVGDQSYLQVGFRDITERKQAEESLRRAHGELEMRVQERTTKLAKTNEELQAEITERKQTREALRESEEKYRFLFDSSLTTTMLIEFGGRIVASNKAGAILFGFDRAEDLIGRNVIDFYKNPKDRDRILDGAKKGGVDRFEVELVKKDGTPVTIWVSNTVVELQGEKVILVSAEDITERKQTRELLKESEQHYRSLFENSIEAVFTVDLAGNLTSVNNAMEELYGYPQGELIGMGYKKTCAPENAEFVFEQYNKIFRTGKAVRDLVYKIVTKDGERRLVEGYVTLLKKENKAVGFQGTLRDITEQKQAEKEIKIQRARFKSIFDHSLEGIVTLLLSSEYVTIIVLRFCHPLSICTLKGLRHGWFGPGLV